MNIYVGNLSYEVSDKDLETAFGEYGQVASARIIMDHETNRPRGFGFVEMANNSEAQTAMSALNGKDLKGRVITANEARPKSPMGGSAQSTRRY